MRSLSIFPAVLRTGWRGPVRAIARLSAAFWRNERTSAAAHEPSAVLRTSHFRQTACFAFIFLLVTLGSIAWGQHLLEQVMVRHVKDMVVAEIRAHQTLNGRESAPTLARTLSARGPNIARRERAAAVQAADGALLYGARELLADDLCPAAKAQPCRGWLRSAKSSSDGMREWLGHAYALPDGGRYIIAYDILPMLNRIYPVPLVVGLSVFTALLMSLGAGLFFSVDAANRISRVRQAMAQFARGDLAARVPLRGRRDEIDQLGKDVNQALERIDFLMEEVRNATNHIAHELRTPLTRLQQRLSSAADNLRGNPAADQEIALAEEEIQRILHLFRSVMRISEIETGRCHHEPARVDLRALLADLHDYYDVLTDHRGLRLRIEIDPGLALHGDRALLFQALVNLADNAMKYAPAGTTVTLLARRTDEGLELGVADEGPGIDAGQRGQAVQRFRRLTHDRTIAGHGLGLALVQAVAALHDGTLVLADNPSLRGQQGTAPGLRGLLAVLRLPAVTRPRTGS